MARRDRTRERALDILRRIEEGAFADALLERARRDLDHRDSAFLLELVYGALRNRARLDWTVNQLSVQPVEKTDAWTRNILRLGVYQMLFLDRVPVSAAVNTATELAKAFGKKSGYVNGLLRNLDRRRGTLADPVIPDPVARLSLVYSHPEWLVARWVRRFGEERAENLLRENNRPAPLVIRTNLLKTTRDELKASLEAEGAETVETAYSPAGLGILSSSGLRSFAAYAKGWFIVQDEAAQLVGLMLGPRPGETVLDACAAPGGKATHLAELMENRGALVALDADPGRIGKLRENSDRLGITIMTHLAVDAARYDGVAPGFDKILIDAPCSGLGVLRRHPDGRWSKNERSIAERAAVQRRILEHCSKLLRPGGALVYATCTTEPEENEDVIRDFLSKHSGFALDDPRRYLPAAAASLVAPDGFFRSFPGGPDLDGFFGARLVKSPGAQQP